MNGEQYLGDDPMGASGSMVTILIVTLTALILFVIPFWKIFQKAGYSGWWSITLMIPGINIFMMYYLAFSEWPSQRGINPALETPPAHPHRAVPPRNV